MTNVGTRFELENIRLSILSEDKLKYLGKTVMRDRHCIMHMFLEYVDSEIDLMIQPEEVVDAKRVNEQELEQMKDEIVETVWERYIQFKMNIIWYYMHLMYIYKNRLHKFSVFYMNFCCKFSTFFGVCGY